MMQSIDNELKCPTCYEIHCAHCKCGKCEPNTKSTDWEKEFRELFFVRTYGQNGENAEKECFKVLTDFIRDLLAQQRAEERENIKKAFWKVFKGSGELFFPSSSIGYFSEEGSENAVAQYWEMLIDELLNSQGAA